MKKLAIALMIAGLLGGLGGTADAAGLGYVNMNKVLANYEPMKAAQADVHQKYVEIQGQYDAQAKTLAPAALKKLQDKLNKDFIDYRARRISEGYNGIGKIIAQVAKAKGIDDVVRQDAMVVGGTDLTPDVLKIITK